MKLTPPYAPRRPLSRPIDEHALTPRERLIYQQGKTDGVREAAQQLHEFGILIPPKDTRWTDGLGNNGEAAWLFDRAEKMENRNIPKQVNG